MSAELPTSDDVRAIVREELERLQPGDARRDWVNGKQLAKELFMRPGDVTKLRREGVLPYIKHPSGVIRYYIPDVNDALRRSLSQYEGKEREGQREELIHHFERVE